MKWWQNYMSNTQAKKPDFRLYKSARGETVALTEGIEAIEAEIDVRVKSLYGVG
jgi:hypothetical protein